MASDTCISFGDLKEPLGGIKVLAVPVEIRGPSDSDTGLSPLLYGKTAGMCFSGSFVTAFLVKEAISDLLSHLQSLESADRLSFERIANAAFEIYAHLSRRFEQSVKYGYDAEFLLGGYCPTEKAIRVFRLFLDDGDGTPRLVECLKDFPHSYEPIGAGSTRFRELYEADRKKQDNRPHFQIPTRIRDIIKEGKILSVAGTIQYGEFDIDDGNFHLYGVIERSEANGIPTRRLFVRGTDLEEAHDETDPFGLHVQYAFKDFVV